MVKIDEQRKIQEEALHWNRICIQYRFNSDELQRLIDISEKYRLNSPSISQLAPMVRGRDYDALEKLAKELRRLEQIDGKKPQPYHRYQRASSIRVDRGANRVSPSGRRGFDE